MALSIYEIATPIYFQILPALSVNIGKAEEHAPRWWVDGISVGGFHIAGIAPHEGNEVIGWLPDHVCMVLAVFLATSALFVIGSILFSAAREHADV